MASKRFLMVPVDSSAARMPRPGATIASATLFSSARFIAVSSKFGSQSGDAGLILYSRAAVWSLRYQQHFDARQRLAFQPFQEGAAGGRDIGQAAGDAGHD